MASRDARKPSQRSPPSRLRGSVDASRTPSSKPRKGSSNSVSDHDEEEDAEDDEGGEEDEDEGTPESSSSSAIKEEVGERGAPWGDDERELQQLLENKQLDDATRKRHVMRLFDRFRNEYTQLSLKQRECVRSQRKIMEKVSRQKHAHTIKCSV